MTKRILEYLVIPPDADGNYVANMEDVLEAYEKALSSRLLHRVHGQAPVQLIGETRGPIPATKELPDRVDFEYERQPRLNPLNFKPCDFFSQLSFGAEFAAFARRPTLAYQKMR